MNVAKPFKLYTLDEFEQMTKEEHITYELIDGIVMMSPRPAAKHQLACGKSSVMRAFCLMNSTILCLVPMGQCA